jgi:pyrimidine oxygenase
MAFSAKYADYNFCIGKGVNTPKAFAPSRRKADPGRYKSRRGATSAPYVLFMIIADETDEAARPSGNTTRRAPTRGHRLAGRTRARPTRAPATTPTSASYADPTSAVNLNMGTLVGSYASVARMLDEMAEVPGTRRRAADLRRLRRRHEPFGERIQPLMKSRVHVDSPVPSQVLPQPLAA